MNHDRLIIVCLVFIGLIQASNCYAGVKVVNASYTGMSSACNNCTQSKFMEDYCCSSSSEWDNGVRNFTDPVPANHSVLSINVTAYVTFDCINYNSSNGAVTVAGNIVGFVPAIIGLVIFSSFFH